MAYVLKRRESIPDNLRRIALAQVDGALVDLRRPKQGESIHEARKRMKKLRAILRLVRPHLEPEVFARENAAYRDIGRRLAMIRDADVLVTVVQDLAPARAREAAYRRVIRHVRQHRRSTRAEFFDDPQTLANLRRGVEDARKRLDDWIDAADRQSVLAGVRTSYRRSRDAFAAARRSHNDTRWHEWRKRTKDFWYQLRLLEPVWPSVMRATISRVKALADLLGDDHDLAVIGHRLMDLPPDAVVSRECRRLRTLIERRRVKLHDEARECGDLLFGDKPKAFASRLDACWRDWRQ